MLILDFKVYIITYMFISLIYYRQFIADLVNILKYHGVDWTQNDIISLCFGFFVCFKIGLECVFLHMPTN